MRSLAFRRLLVFAPLFVHFSDCSVFEADYASQCSTVQYPASIYFFAVCHPQVPVHDDFSVRLGEPSQRMEERLAANPTFIGTGYREDAHFFCNCP